MSTALTKPPSGSKIRGAVPAVASAILPGAGQLINRQRHKAIGVFTVVAGAIVLRGLPLIGSAAWLVGAATYVYGVADAYFTGKKKA